MLEKVYRFFYQLPAVLVRYQIAVLAFWGLMFLLAFANMGKLKMDLNIEAWFAPDDPVLLTKAEFDRKFGSNEDVYLVLKAKDHQVFSQNSLAALRSLHGTLNRYKETLLQDPASPLKHIREIRSMVNETLIEASGDDLYIREFMGNRALLEGSELKAIAAMHPLFPKRYLSDDNSVTAITIKTDFGSANPDAATAITTGPSIDTEGLGDLAAPDNTAQATTSSAQEYEAYVAFMHALNDLIASADIGDHFEVYPVGLPPLIAYQVEVFGSEMGMIFLGTLLIICVVIGFSLRHPAGVLWSVSILLGTVLLTVGLIGASGRSMTDLLHAMILLLIITGVADSIHILSGYRHHYQHTQNRLQALQETIAKSGLSVLLTSFTTSMGFISLMLMPLEPVQRFGFFSAIGVMIAFLLTVTLLPVLIHLWPPVFGNSDKAPSTAHRTYRILHWFETLAIKNSKAVVLGALAITLVLGLGLNRLSINTDSLAQLEKNSSVRQAFELADAKMAGGQNLDVMISLGSVNGVQNLQVLTAMDQFQTEVKRQYPELVVTSWSVVDFLKWMNQKLHQDDNSYFRLPETEQMANELLFLFNNASPEERRRLVDDEFASAHISFSVRNSGSEQYMAMLKNIDDIQKRLFDPLKQAFPQLKVDATGGVVLYISLFDLMSQSQFNSYLTAFLGICLTMLVVFGSLSYGLFAMIPNVIPLVITFGLMGWLNIPLDTTTLIIAPIILGISVDDTIHFLNHFRLAYNESNDVYQAVSTTLQEVGPAVTFTSMILCLGLLTMVFSSHQSMAAFGKVSAFALGTAWLAEILFFPALCILMGKVQQRTRKLMAAAKRSGSVPQI